MGRKICDVAVLNLLLAIGASPCFSQTSSELMDFLSKRIGLKEDQIAAVQNGQALARNVDARGPGEIFLFGVGYINAAPEGYLKHLGDLARRRYDPAYLAISKFSDPPQISDLKGFGFDSDDVKSLKNCKPGDCSVQIPVSSAMDELRKSVNWSSPNVNDEVNQYVRKLALSRMQEYQKEGSSIFSIGEPKALHLFVALVDKPRTHNSACHEARR